MEIPIQSISFWEAVKKVRTGELKPCTIKLFETITEIAYLLIIGKNQTKLIRVKKPIKFYLNN